MMMNRRTVLGGLAALGAAALGGAGWLLARPALAKAGEVVVYKSPTCGCCGAWIEHMRANGFSVAAHDVDDVAPVKAMLGLAPELHSCHTAVVDGYLLEGHVPAADVRRLLTERPLAKGLAVPGMPGGSPGMESAPKEAYDVVLVLKDGGTRVFARR